MAKYLLLNRIALSNGIEIKAGKEFDDATFPISEIIGAGGVLALQPVPAIVALRVAQVREQESKGRRDHELDELTAAQAESAAGAANQVGVADEGLLLGLFSIINVTGAGAIATDSGGGVAEINVPGSSGGVPATRTLTAGQGLTGGGDLSADRQFDVGSPLDGSIQVNADSIQVGVLATDAQHGVRGGGNLHALVTPDPGGDAGFMSPADKLKLDGIASGATNTPLSNANPTGIDPDDAADPGVAASASRSDHQHAISTDTPVAVDKSPNAEGAAGSFARSDHKHDTSTAAPVDVGIANAEGAATTLARSDHVHDLPFTPVQQALAAATGAVSVNGQQITNLADPIAATDAVNLQTLTSAVSAVTVDWKLSCRLATTVNVDLTTGGLIAVDGVVTTSGDRVLVRAQTLPEQNGIYVAAAGAWVRATDANSSVEVTSGLTAYASEGASLAGTYWALTTFDPIVLGTTPLAFELLGLITSAAPVNVDKSAAAAGTSTRAARADHKHDVSTAAPVTISSANAEGVATTISRSDHVHAHGAQGGGTQHAVATTVTAGFMSAADKVKLDATADGFRRHFLLMGG